MCYTDQDDREHGCLSSTVDYSQVTLDMSKGYDPCSVKNGYRPSVHNHIMDMIGRDTSFSFDKQARNGFIEAGYDSGYTKRELHVQMMPFRPFLEQSHHCDTVEMSDIFKDLGSTWGALILLDMIYVDHDCKIIRTCYGDQRWFLDLYEYVSREDEELFSCQFRLDSETIVSRISQLFTELDNCYVGDHRMNDIISPGLYSMHVRKITINDPVLIQIAKELDDAAPESFKFFNYQEQPGLTTPELVTMAGVLQQTFDKIKAHATGINLPPMTFAIEGIKSSKDLEVAA